MKIVAIAWTAQINMLAKAARNIPWLDIELFPIKRMDDQEFFEKAWQACRLADAVLLCQSSEGFWEELNDKLKDLTPKPSIIYLGYDASNWANSTVSLPVLQACHNYLIMGGEDNYTNLLRFLGQELAGTDSEVPGPQPVPWEALYHPAAGVPFFAAVDDYLAWHKGYAQERGLDRGPWVGLLMSRHTWVNRDLAVDDCLIAELEAQGLRVLPVFSHNLRDKGLGNKGGVQVIQEFFMTEQGEARIEALVRLQSYFLGLQKGDGAEETQKAKSGSKAFAALNVPVFQPVVSSYKSPEEWEQDAQGLGSDVTWSVSMPEFEGSIEPLIIGGANRTVDGGSGAPMEERTPIAERCAHLAKRVKKWVALRRKPVEQRRVAFIFNNNPCASVEATVGGAAGLDSLESVARILATMRAVGYAVEVPASGKELIENILSRKAISEFRWTTVDEIVKKGGALNLLPLKTYLKWWEGFPEEVKEKLRQTWGDPPGQEMDGVPPAMVYKGQIVITGVSYGNAVICVQPKRGCAGSRCDGQVCKILHDPAVPPPHQYLATYRWLEKVFRADVVVNVGTHGSLEWLPGKGVGLSRSCLPDLAIDELPHLYIYNADNPAEGVVAKRRGYAALLDHLQTVMTQAGLYGELEELDRMLAEYEQARITDHSRAHTLQHLILDMARQAKLGHQVDLDKGHYDFAETAREIHEALALIRNSQTNDGMHIFGELPQDEARQALIYSILRYDAGEEHSLRKTICQLMSLELGDLLANPGFVHPRWHKSHGQLLEEVDQVGREAVAVALGASSCQSFQEGVRRILGERLVCDSTLPALAEVWDRLDELVRRLEESREIDSLLNGFRAGHVPAGPSGLITRGRDDVLPTGRNFYSLDPRKIPTPAAYRVGEGLAKAVMEKHQQEQGRFPQNVAICWMCSDIMWSDGEGMGQILSLLGVRPRWAAGGRVSGFEIIPLPELGRPRVDVTIKVSGITRDNFPECMELVDEAVVAVASLEEPLEQNFVRKHSLEKLNADPGQGSQMDPWREATLRLFCTRPGTYQGGVSLAVYASAWKDIKDLSDIYLFFNGYGYGKGVFGSESHGQLASSLKTVDVTFSKVVSDEHDLLGCCCYFGGHGGMTAAARHVSGQQVKAYYGDTREPEQVAVRDLADEVRRVVRTKLLNPKRVEGMKRHGYKGAGDISKRVGRVYGWEATTQEVDDWIFDDIVRTFVMDEENRKFFQENNPWALEEMGRRLLEAHSRGLWEADPDALAALKEAYLEMEGWLEENMGEVEGNFQGGSVDIFAPEDVEEWKQMMKQMKL